jgi:ribose/xylose/arabinose/galactoside ABC-type transport system permease subunit
MTGGIIAEAAKATPPVTVIGLHSFFGVPVAEWLMLLTAVYTAFQLYFLLRDRWWRMRGKV